MTKKIDMHTHILPEMDDGSPDVDISVRLIDVLQEQGVTHIALTPHFYAHQEALHTFLERREMAFNVLKAAKAYDVSFVLGSEVFVTDKLFQCKDLSALCYQNTCHMLTEFMYHSPFADLEAMARRLIEDYGIRPLFAHIERYPALMEYTEGIKKLIGLGCHMQINLDSLHGWRLRKHLLKLIKEGLVHVVGTDTHSLSKGLDYNTGFQIIEKKLGVQYCHTLTNHALNIITGQ